MLDCDLLRSQRNLVQTGRPYLDHPKLAVNLKGGCRFFRETLPLWGMCLRNKGRGGCSCELESDIPKFGCLEWQIRSFLVGTHIYRSFLACKLQCSECE